jgi:hypothetical protein
MKIELPNKEDGFGIYEHEFCGIPSYLIIPAIDAKWNKNNLYFRSLVVDKKELTPLSCGWPKFFNYGEKPDCYPNPEKFKDWNIQDKLDGSLVICDYVNNKFNMRTRGTVSYISQENFKDFELLKTKNPLIVEYLKQNSHLSLLFEIITPNNVIVIRSDEVDFYFLGAVNKKTLEVLSENEILEISKKLSLKLPQKYSFNSLSDVVQLVKSWKGKEGIVLNYNNNKNRIKVKSDWYCWIHKIKSQLNSENNLIEFYINEGMPTFNKFYKTIEKNFDFELAEQMKGEISRLCNARNKVLKIVKHMKEFIRVIQGYDTRKEQAQTIMSSYGGGENSRASMLFTLLDGKELSKAQYTKLLHQCLR